MTTISPPSRCSTSYAQTKGRCANVSVNEKAAAMHDDEEVKSVEADGTADAADVGSGEGGGRGAGANEKRLLTAALVSSIEEAAAEAASRDRRSSYPGRGAGRGASSGSSSPTVNERGGVTIAPLPSRPARVTPNSSKSSSLPSSEGGGEADALERSNAAIPSSGVGSASVANPLAASVDGGAKAADNVPVRDSAGFDGGQRDPKVWSALAQPPTSPGMMTRKRRKLAAAEPAPAVAVASAQRNSPRGGKGRAAYTSRAAAPIAAIGAGVVVVRDPRGAETVGAGASALRGPRGADTGLATAEPPASSAASATVAIMRTTQVAAPTATRRTAEPVTAMRRVATVATATKRTVYATAPVAVTRQIAPAVAETTATERTAAAMRQTAPSVAPATMIMRTAPSAAAPRRTAIGIAPAAATVRTTPVVAAMKRTAAVTRRTAPGISPATAMMRTAPVATATKQTAAAMRRTAPGISPATAMMRTAPVATATKRTVPGVAPATAAMRTAPVVAVTKRMAAAMRRTAPGVSPLVVTRRTAPGVVPSVATKRTSPGVVPPAVTKRTSPGVVPPAVTRRTAPGVVPSTAMRRMLPAAAPPARKRMTPAIAPPHPPPFLASRQQSHELPSAASVTAPLAKVNATAAGGSGNTTRTRLAIRPPATALAVNPAIPIARPPSNGANLAVAANTRAAPTPAVRLVAASPAIAAASTSVMFSGIADPRIGAPDATATPAAAYPKSLPLNPRIKVDTGGGRRSHGPLPTSLSASSLPKPPNSARIPTQYAKLIRDLPNFMGDHHHQRSLGASSSQHPGVHHAPKNAVAKITDMARGNNRTSFQRGSRGSAGGVRVDEGGIAVGATVGIAALPSTYSRRVGAGAGAPSPVPDPLAARRDSFSSAASSGGRAAADRSVVVTAAFPPAATTAVAGPRIPPAAAAKVRACLNASCAEVPPPAAPSAPPAAVASAATVTFAVPDTCPSTRPLPSMTSWTTSLMSAAPNAMLPLLLSHVPEAAAGGGGGQSDVIANAFPSVAPIEEPITTIEITPQPRGRIFSIDLDPAVLDFVESVVDPLQAIAEEIGGVGVVVPQAPTPSPYAPEVAFLSNNGDSVKAAAVVDDHKNQTVKFKLEEVDVLGDHEEGRGGYRRDRGFSFEFFSFGINEHEPLPRTSDVPDVVESSGSRGNRPRGDSIIFDPTSFHEGGIHETSALMQIKEESESFNLDDLNADGLTTTIGHSNGTFTQVPAQLAQTPVLVTIPIPDMFNAVVPPPAMHHHFSPQQANPPVHAQAHAPAHASVTNVRRPAPYGLVAANPRAKCALSLTSDLTPLPAFPATPGTAAFAAPGVAKDPLLPQSFTDNTIHMPHGSDAAAAAAAGMIPSITGTSSSDGTTVSHTACPMDLLNKGGRIGIYLPEERKARIAKFHSKRKVRIWRKRIKYDCRKKLADSRPRIKGRFVKRSDVDGEED